MVSGKVGWALFFGVWMRSQILWMEAVVSGSMVMVGMVEI